MKKIIIYIIILSVYSCDIFQDADDMGIFPPTNYKILSIGDSYTIGQSVCDECNFPIQLKDSLQIELSRDTINVEIIAVTGWTTTSLINNLEPIIENDSLDNIFKNNDLVTLLIGVNNQYQNKPFEVYEQEFPELVNTAISLTKSQSNSDVIVISIPDYAFTPYGQSGPNPSNTSQEIDMYNNFAENFCLENSISFIDITDITRLGLINSELVASDNLHPSELAYKKFVERIFPVAFEKLFY